MPWDAQQHRINHFLSQTESIYETKHLLNALSKSHTKCIGTQFSSI